MLYIDESGSITKSTDPNKRFFIISAVYTDEPLKVRRVFRNAKVKFLNDHTSKQYEKLDVSTEIKGSEMNLIMKKFIFKELKEKTDIRFHYLILDNNHLIPDLKDNVELCFNYTLCLFLRTMLVKYPVSSLFVKLDERNCTVKSLNSLGDYLRIELQIRTKLVGCFEACEYTDSKSSDLVQIADIVSNTVYRATNEDNSGNANLMKEYFTQGNMYFPYKHNQLSCFENDIKYIDTSTQI